MVKISSFLISSAIYVALYSPLLAMEDDTQDFSGEKSSIAAGVEPSWVYSEYEDDRLICSFLQGNLSVAESNKDLAEEDKKALARIKGM